MDLLIKKIKNGPHCTDYKVTAYNDKGRFVVDHFNPNDPFGSYGKPKIAILRGEYELDMMYKLIKLAGELSWETKGFNYEIVEADNEAR